jgi:hypothetical protein
MHINIEMVTVACTRIYGNINWKIYTKWTNCGGNSITGNVVSVWRMWRVRAQILSRISAQEHDTYTTMPIGALLWNLHTIFYCNCIRHNLVLFAVFFSLMFWVAHLTNKNNATTFCIITKYFLFCKTFKLSPTKRAHCSTCQLMSLWIRRVFVRHRCMCVQRESNWMLLNVLLHF